MARNDCFLLLLIFTSLVVSCNEAVVERTVTTAAVPLGFTSIVNPGDGPSFAYDRLAVDEAASSAMFVNFGSLYREDDTNLLRYHTGLIRAEEAAGRLVGEDLISVRFYTPTLRAEENPGPDELQAEFSVGHRYRIGNELGEVEFGIVLPAEEAADRQLSRAAFSDTGGGAIEVIAHETVTYFDPVFDREAQLALLVFSFTATVGVYDDAAFRASEAAGVPYRAERSVTVEGTVRLVASGRWNFS